MTIQLGTTLGVDAIRTRIEQERTVHGISFTDDHLDRAARMEIGAPEGTPNGWVQIQIYDPDDRLIAVQFLA